MTPLVLVLTASEDARNRLGATLHVAHFDGVFALNRESALAAVDRTHPELVLLDTDLPVPGAFINEARRAGVAVLYFSSHLSTYDLAVFARQRGLSHVSLQADAYRVGILLDEALARRNIASCPVVIRDDLAEVIHSASELVQQSRTLTAKSQEAKAQSRDLRAAQQIMLAACRHSVRAVRESVMSTARELRDDGVSLARVLELVTAGLARSVEIGARDVPDAAEARAWAEESYRAA